jgi:hypothetical protein
MLHAQIRHRHLHNSDRLLQPRYSLRPGRKAEVEKANKPTLVIRTAREHRLRKPLFASIPL